jgi:putative SOS response-associated peptidase YedK
VIVFVRARVGFLPTPTSIPGVRTCCKDGSFVSFEGATSAEQLHTFTIVTTDPNELASQVHDRMPVILEGEDCATWLDPDIKDAPTLLELRKPIRRTK